jgi:hypothetical protein
MNDEIKYDIYILKENRFGSIDLFTRKEERHYVQYKKKWDEKLSIKYWTLEELVWEYEYGDYIKKVELIKKTISL